MKIIYRVSPSVSNDALNRLFTTAWEHYVPRDFTSVLNHSLLYICAYAVDHRADDLAGSLKGEETDERLVGFVNVAWDGGAHAFLLDTTVHAEAQHGGIGTELVKRAAAAARERSIEWLHVDFEPHLLDFYRDCGFRHTEAGLMNLKEIEKQDK